LSRLHKTVMELKWQRQKQLPFISPIEDDVIILSRILFCFFLDFFLLKQWNSTWHWIELCSSFMNANICWSARSYLLYNHSCTACIHMRLTSHRLCISSTLIFCTVYTLYVDTEKDRYTWTKHHQYEQSISRKISSRPMKR